MTKTKILESTTDYFLIITSLVLFGLEIIAVFTDVDLITDRIVRFSVFQVWIPLVLGSLMGHFFPITQKYSNIKAYLIFLVSSVVGYIIWYIYATEVQVIAVVTAMAEYMWVTFLSGYTLGGLFFGRTKHALEE